jgi:hypothetical protein
VGGYKFGFKGDTSIGDAFEKKVPLKVFPLPFVVVERGGDGADIVHPDRTSKMKKLTPNIAPMMLPIRNMKTIITPLNTSIDSRLHLINAAGIAIMMGRVIAVSTIAMPPRMKVE